MDAEFIFWNRSNGKLRQSDYIFLWCPTAKTQKILYKWYSNALKTRLISLEDPQGKIRIMSASSFSATAFLHVPLNTRRCKMSNTEFEIVVKFRLSLAFSMNIPEQRVCDISPDVTGHHWMKCNGKWMWHEAHCHIQGYFLDC